MEVRLFALAIFTAVAVAFLISGKRRRGFKGFRRVSRWAAMESKFLDWTGAYAGLVGVALVLIFLLILFFIFKPQV